MIKLDFIKKNDIEAFDPLELLEMSIALCLFTTIKKETIPNIRDMEVMISGGKIRVLFRCDPKVEEKIREAIKSCFVINHTNFEVNLNFEE